jgi:hypothetical protein
MKTKLLAVALAAAFAVPAGAYSEREHTGLKWEILKKIGEGIVLIKSVAEAIQWANGIINPPAPEVRAADLWYCDPSVCSFAIAPGSIVPTDIYQQAMNFIASIGKTFAIGEMITVCNGWVCIPFTYTGDGFAPGKAMADPRAGYSNRPSGAAGGAYEASGGGYGGVRTGTYYSGAVNPSYGFTGRGSVTTTWGGGMSYGGGGGGGGHFTGDLMLD